MVAKKHLPHPAPVPMRIIRFEVPKGRVKQIPAVSPDKPETRENLVDSAHKHKRRQSRNIQGSAEGNA